MSKAIEHSIMELRGWQHELGIKLDGLEGHVSSFRRVSQEYETFIRCQFKGKRDLATNVNLKHALQNWLRSFVAVLDECFIYLSGAFSRTSYFAVEHGPYVHDRGPQEEEYEKMGCRSRMSVDGLDYEYRRLVRLIREGDLPPGKQASLEAKIENFEFAADDMTGQIKAYENAVNGAFWDPVAHVLKDIGATSVDTRWTLNKHGNASVHNNEFIRAMFPTADGDHCCLLEVERSTLPPFDRKTGLAPMADLDGLGEAGATQARRREGKLSKRVVMDDDDDDNNEVERARARAAAAKAAPEVFDFSVNKIKDDVNKTFDCPPPPPPPSHATTQPPLPGGGGGADDLQGMLTSEAVLAFANTLGGGGTVDATGGPAAPADAVDGQSGASVAAGVDGRADTYGADVVVLDLRSSAPPPAPLVDPACAGHPAVDAYARRVAHVLGAHHRAHPGDRGGAAGGDPHPHAALEDAVRPVVAATCTVVAAAAAGPAARPPAFDVSHAVVPGITTPPMRGLYESVFEASFAAAAAAWPPGRRPAVDVSCVGVGGRVLAMAVLHASAVTANSCGFDPDDAATAAAHIRAAAAAHAVDAVPMEVDGEDPAGLRPPPQTQAQAQTEALSPLTSLVLRSNRFLSTDSDCRGDGEGGSVPGPASPLPPAVTALADAADAADGNGPEVPLIETGADNTCLLAAALETFPALAVLDVSYCAASEAECARLAVSLCRALRLRRRRGLPPLDTLTVRGLAHAWPALATALARAVAPDLVVVTDFEGVQRALTLQM